MSIQNNSFARSYNQFGVVMGLMTCTSGTPVISQLSGNAIDRANVSVADTASGVSTVSITNFKGPQGFAKVFVTAVAVGGIAASATPTYSGNTCSFAVSMTDAAASATDLDYQFIVWAY